MASTASPQPPTRAAGPPPSEPGRRGILTFAAVMLLIAATANALWGIAALVSDDYFAADELWFGDLSVWGGVYLAFAAAQIATALLIFSRSPLGASLGIFIVGLNAVAQLVAIGAYPIWSIIGLVIDGLIIYGLCSYGFED